MGVIPSYVDQTGREKRITTDNTRVAILAAMGIDASTEERAAAALTEFRLEARRDLLEPVRVVEVEDGHQCMCSAELRLRAGTTPVVWEGEVTEESGAVHRVNGRATGSATISIRLPALPIGYHALSIRVQRGRQSTDADQTLIVVPPRCTSPDELLGGDSPRAFGIVANLYSVHSERNWGVGDFTDLGTLAEWAGAQGADFVGVNPLHALLDAGKDISPYSPVSRLFRNVLYIDVERVPELAVAPHVADRIASPPFQAELAVLREDPRVQYERSLYLKIPVLEELYALFRESAGGGAPAARAAEFRRWVAEQEPELTQFAVFMARQWRSAAANGGAPPNDDDVQFQRWLQFEADRQLGDAAERARRAGMRLGLYQDLAIGSSPNGSDVASRRDLFAKGASIGAPPDPYSATGQYWGLPPIDPRRLRQDRYRYFVKLVRNGFRHSGALRIDHIMGLFRLFWIPAGLTGREGAYVRMPAHDLLGILALESVRHRALVVGEDLGTVPKDVPPALNKWGILSSKVLYFERAARGAFKPPERYAELALATANTHDMPTLAGFFSGHDIELRAQTKLLRDETEVARARDERRRDHRRLMRVLRASGVTGDGSLQFQGPRLAGRMADLTGAIHAFLCRAPSVLVGLALDDLTGEEEAVNLPGVGPEMHASWTRKMKTPIEALWTDDYVNAALRCDGRMRRRTSPETIAR